MPLSPTFLRTAIAIAFVKTAAPALPWSASVVKIHVTVQRPNPVLPWQDGPPNAASGSGFVIQEGGKRRLLTNAHVVSDARYLEVQREGDARRFPARVAFVGHDCDLAVLEVTDPAFWDGTRPLRLGSTLPALDEQVIAVGYPIGGNRLSITRGIVSRIDYQVYSHSEVDSHLVLQIDAAINPGNSGGPVLYRGRVVGVAFQGIRGAQNIGYAIPIPVIRHFLDDIADDRYDGYPDLGVTHLTLRNPALRRAAGLPPDRSGILVARLDPHGSAAGRLQPGDVLLSIDKVPIRDDGTIRIDGQPVEFIELFERKQVGDNVTFEVWRSNTVHRIALTLVPTSPAFHFGSTYDTPPPYFVLGGLVFSPLSRELLIALQRQLNTPQAQHLLYAWLFGRADGLHETDQERVVLIGRLPHPINAYADPFVMGAVASVNDRPIRSLADLPTALASPINGFHVIRFHDRPDFLALPAKEADDAWPEISDRYRVLASQRLPSPPQTASP